MRAGRSPIPRAVLAAALVFVVAAVALSLLHGRSVPHYRLSEAAAISAARLDPGVAGFLRGRHGTEVRTVPLDRDLRRVTFFAGPRVLLDAAVDARGRVLDSERHVAGVPQSGSRLANAPWLLLVFSAVFLLCTLVVPLRRVRNLDALALAALSLTIVLVNERLVAASVAVSSPLLAYLAVRCLRVGLRPARAPRRPAAEPLLRWLARRGAPGGEGRLLRLLTVATLTGFLLITLTSSGYSDVAVASLSGATDLLHGQLPYGHILQGVVHGDTYPLLNYVVYMPAAAWRPATDVFSDFTGALAVSAAAALLGALALHRLATADEPRPGAGARAVIAWLAFPPVLLAASGGSNDLVLAAALAWLLVLGRRPGGSMLILTAAAWVKVVPLILAPVWLVRVGRRQALRSLIPALGLSAALAGWLLTLGGIGAIAHMGRSLAFQYERGSFFAPWYTFGVGWLQPLLQAAVLTVLAVCVWRTHHEAVLRADGRRLAALGGALLLGVQLTANYWTWSYLPWAYPFLAVALLTAPRVGARRAQPAPGPRYSLRRRRLPAHSTPTSPGSRTPIPS